MKLSVRSSAPVTGDQFKKIIDDLNEEFSPYGVKVKNMTCYIRFIDEAGETIDMVDRAGNSLERIVTFNKIKKTPIDEKSAGKDKPKKNPQKKPSIFDIT